MIAEMTEILQHLEEIKRAAEDMTPARAMKIPLRKLDDGTYLISPKEIRALAATLDQLEEEDWSLVIRIVEADAK